jgi:magnesium chelatase family protein
VGDRGGCTCAAHQIERYRRRLSGPLLDRFDLHVPVGRARSSDLLAREAGESTAAVAERVRAARSIARTRGVACNAELPAHRLDELAPLDPAARRLLERRVESGDLSGRGLARVRRVARTIGDLAGEEGPVSAEFAATAVELRAGRRVLAGDSRWAA